MKPKGGEGGSWLALASGKDASPWTMFSNAIVLQAVDDYRVALRTVVEKEKWLDSEDGENASPKERANAQKKIVNAWKVIKEVEAFFRSKTCRIFTELDMTIIAKRIKSEFHDIEFYE